jgi:hypothetical protein
MKLTRYKKWTVLALALANGFFAAAQSNGVPGPTDYARFSSFVTERNIFDPGRYARNYSQHYQPTRAPRFAPTFTLVGTMSYEKGMFAFFDGNNSDLRKALSESDSIAGYTVTEITLAGVTLQTADKKETVQMKIGDSMRQEGSSWQLAGKGELSADMSVTEGTAPAAGNASPDTSAAPSPAIDGNDVLKRLMQKREQELK